MKNLQDTREILKAVDKTRIDVYDKMLLIDSLELIDKLEPYLTQLTENNLLDKGYEWIQIDNSYNWNAPLTHDFNIRVYQNIENTFLVINWHISGDIRGNYTETLVYLCESRDWAYWLSEIWEELESARKWVFIPETKWEAYINLNPLSELKYVDLNNVEDKNVITYDSYEVDLDWIIKEAQEKIEEEEKEKNEQIENVLK